MAVPAPCSLWRLSLHAPVATVPAQQGAPGHLPLKGCGQHVTQDLRERHPLWAKTTQGKVSLSHDQHVPPSPQGQPTAWTHIQQNTCLLRPRGRDEAARAPVITDTVPKTKARECQRVPPPPPPSPTHTHGLGSAHPDDRFPCPPWESVTNSHLGAFCVLRWSFYNLNINNPIFLQQQGYLLALRFTTKLIFNSRFWLIIKINSKELRLPREHEQL